MRGVIAAGEVRLRRSPTTSRPVEFTAFPPRLPGLPERSRSAFHESKAQHDPCQGEPDFVVAYGHLETPERRHVALCLRNVSPSLPVPLRQAAAVPARDPT